MKGRLYSFLAVGAVLFFAFLSGFALLHPGLPPTHDGEYHVIRFYLFNESFKDGNLYPRWAAHLNNGFGVPLFTFVYPLPNYIAVFLHSLGISFIDSFRIEMFAAIIIGAIFFYLWAKEFWGRLGGIVSSVFYTFSPYHFVDIYIRGSVGEVWALAFFPAFLWAYTRFVKSKRKIFLATSSLFLGFIIFSHNILALMFFFFSLSYVGLLIYKEKNKKYLILNTFYLILLGLGFSAIFWLPAIYETKFATGLQIFDVAAHFPELYQLLIPTWGSGFSGAGIQNELSFQIGIANLISVFIASIVFLFQLKNKDNRSFHTFFFLGWFIFVLFLMLNTSLPIWRAVPFMKYFQFPWRLLSIEIIFAAFLAGSIFSLIRGHIWIKACLATFLVLLVFILSVGYTKPAYYLEREDKYYITRSNFIDGTNSIGNVFNTTFLKTIPDKEKERAKFFKGEGEISLISSKSNEHTLRINVHKNSEILINLPYYPGWEVYVNNDKREIKPTSDGRFTFLVYIGENLAKITFRDTPMRRTASAISLLSLIFILTLFIKYKSSKI